ncbi:MAG: class I SAM-dependent methyltransferase [candidate division Zixibacteria bacterium]
MPDQKKEKDVDLEKPRQTYTLPQIYDIAFDFRDVSEEVDFLLGISEKQIGRKVKSAFEMACGPAYHTREIARRGVVSVGLDIEPAMVKYTQELIAKENIKADIFVGDMRSFKSDKKYDLVYMLMASFAQLLTNKDIIDNFNCAANLLTDGGIYIISTAHPRDFYGDEKPTVKNTWEMTRGDIKVMTDWGGDDQKFDALTEIDDIVVSFDVTTPEGKKRYEFPDRYRRCSIKTFEAFVELSGRFEIVDRYGAVDPKIKLSNASESWRFVPILKKVK